MRPLRQHVVLASTVLFLNSRRINDNKTSFIEGTHEISLPAMDGGFYGTRDDRSVPIGKFCPVCAQHHHAAAESKRAGCFKHDLHGRRQRSDAIELPMVV